MGRFTNRLVKIIGCNFQSFWLCPWLPAGKEDSNEGNGVESGVEIWWRASASARWQEEEEGSIVFPKLCLSWIRSFSTETEGPNPPDSPGFTQNSIEFCEPKEIWKMSPRGIHKFVLPSSMRRTCPGQSLMATFRSSETGIRQLGTVLSGAVMVILVS